MPLEEYSTTTPLLRCRLLWSSCSLKAISLFQVPIERHIADSEGTGSDTPFSSLNAEKLADLSVI